MSKQHKSTNKLLSKYLTPMIYESNNQLGIQRVQACTC